MLGWWEVMGSGNFANFPLNLVVLSSYFIAIQIRIEPISLFYWTWRTSRILQSLDSRLTCIFALAGTASLSLDRWVKQHHLNCPWLLGIKVLAFNSSSWLNIQINVLSH